MFGAFLVAMFDRLAAAVLQRCVPRLVRTARCRARRLDHRRHPVHRRPSRPVAARPSSPASCSAHPSCTSSASRCSISASRSQASWCWRRPRATDDGPVGGGMTQAVNFIDGLDGLAAGVVAIAAAAFTIYAQRLSDGGLARAGEHRAAPRGHRLRRLSRATCPTTSTRRRSSWATVVPTCPGPADGGVDAHRRWPHRRSVQRSDVLLLRADLHPAVHPRCADARRRVLHRAPHRPTQGRRPPPTPSTSTTASMRLGHGQRRVGAHPVDLDGAALGVRALPDLR